MAPHAKEATLYLSKNYAERVDPASIKLPPSGTCNCWRDAGREPNAFNMHVPRERACS